MVSDLEIFLRLFLASVLGALVGLEREVHGREAGIRTYLLVSLGSALIMIVSEYLSFKYEGRFAGDFLRADPTKARRNLGWTPRVRFEELVHMMVDADMELLGIR